jgi:hypothetical protein
MYDLGECLKVSTGMNSLCDLWFGVRLQVLPNPPNRKTTADPSTRTAIVLAILAQDDKSEKG